LKNQQVKENVKKLFNKKINVEEEQIQPKEVRSLSIKYHYSFSILLYKLSFIELILEERYIKAAETKESKICQ